MISSMKTTAACCLLVAALLYLSTKCQASATAACLACPGQVRNSIQQFCGLPLLPFLLSKDNCVKMETKNTDDQLKKKVCEPLGICGGKYLGCNKCKLTYKSVLDSLCTDIDGYLFDWGLFKQSYADVCRLFVHLTPPDFLTVACDKVGCKTGPPPTTTPTTTTPTTTTTKKIVQLLWKYYPQTHQSKWQYIYPKCSATNPIGSPIAIKTTRTVKTEFEPSLYSLKSKIPGKLVNDGRMVKFVPNDAYDSGSPTQIMGLNDMVNWNFYEIHFKWGKSNTRGADHEIDFGNGKYIKFALEMQIIWVRKDYSFTNANKLTKDKPGFRIYSVLFERDDSHLPGAGQSPLAFENDLAKLQGKPVGEGVAVTWNTAWMKDFFAKKPTFYYIGSLTFPPCGAAKWIVGYDGAKVTASTMNIFRSLKDPRGNSKPFQEGNTTKMNFKQRKVDYYTAN